MLEMPLNQEILTIMPKLDEKDVERRLEQAYESLLSHTHSIISETKKQLGLPLKEAIAKARERMVELGELSREEIDKVSRYLERDVEDAASYLAESGEEFRQWLKFDWQLVESRLFDMVSTMADETSLQLRDIAERAKQASAYKKGEVTGPGTLVCTKCGEEVPTIAVNKIGSCPSCGGQTFKRMGVV